MEQRVFPALETKNTYINVPPAKINDYARGYSEEGAPTRVEHVFEKGDFYVIEPGVAYDQKSAPGTEILFIKVPPGNDKMPVDTTPEVEAWYREPIKEEKR